MGYITQQVYSRLGQRPPRQPGESDDGGPASASAQDDARQRSTATPMADGQANAPGSPPQTPVPQLRAPMQAGAGVSSGFPAGGPQIQAAPIPPAPQSQRPGVTPPAAAPMFTQPRPGAPAPQGLGLGSAPPAGAPTQLGPPGLMAAPQPSAATMTPPGLDPRAVAAARAQRLAFMRSMGLLR